MTQPHMDGLKCSKCMEVKPFDAFYVVKTWKRGYTYLCKSCSLKEHKKYYYENQDKEKRRGIEYYHANKNSAHTKELLIKRHDSVLEAQRRYKNSHREEIRARQRERYAKNPEKFRLRNRIWAKQHREAEQLRLENRRARIKQAEGKITKEEWGRLLQKYNNRCLCCGSTEKVTMDHVVPISLGGENTIGNIQPLCKSCNSRKGVNIIDYRINYEEN